MQGNLQGSRLSKRRFFLLSGCYFLRYLNVQGEDRRRRRRLVPPKFLSPRELYLVLSSRPSPIDERLLASNLGISFFPSYRFGVAVKENSIVLETYPRPRR